MTLNAPHRKYELTLTLNADDWRALLGAIRHIEFELTVKSEFDAPVHIVSGGYDSGWTLDVAIHPGVTHESYVTALHAYLDARAAAKANGGAS